jgi:uncharacterized protein YhbP (UPF0306 family)
MNDKLDPVRSLLRTQTTLVLATVGEDGLPRSTALFYVTDESLNLYWFSSRSSLHSRNCARNPEASVAISTDARTWQEIKGAQMQGRISLVADRALRKSITADYVKHFALGNFFSLAIRRSSLYRFTPRWVRYIDNSRRFGYQVEFDLSQSMPETSTV